MYLLVSLYVDIGNSIYYTRYLVRYCNERDEFCINYCINWSIFILVKFATESAHNLVLKNENGTQRIGR